MTLTDDKLDDLTPQVRRAYGVDRELQKGVVITHVKPVSPAGDANLAEGDVILEVNGAAVGSVEELQAQMKKAPKSKYIRLYVQRGGGRGPALAGPQRGGLLHRRGDQGNHGDGAAGHPAV